jgi:hypothetical protein
VITSLAGPIMGVEATVGDVGIEDLRAESALELIGRSIRLAGQV